MRNVLFQYLGTWYDIESYPVRFQDGTCPTATYTASTTGVDVFNTQVVGQQLDTIEGSAVLTTDDGQAKLNVSFPIAGTNRKYKIICYLKLTSSKTELETTFCLMDKNNL